jgi:hypothetical protein
MQTTRYRNYANTKKGRKPKLPFVFGLDYLFVKKVKGIKPRRIAAREQKVVARELRQRLKQHLTQALK